jgi:hypothetical protein
VAGIRGGKTDCGNVCGMHELGWGLRIFHRIKYRNSRVRHVYMVGKQVVKMFV